MKTLITGCSWIQRMHKQNKIKNLDIDYASFGGQGLWKISDKSNKRFRDSRSF
jgi:protoporphyrinogen oxidase